MAENPEVQRLMGIIKYINDVIDIKSRKLDDAVVIYATTSNFLYSDIDVYTDYT